MTTNLVTLSNSIELTHNVNDIIELFAMSIRKADTTRCLYKRILKLFFGWCSERGYEVDTLTDTHITQYLDELAQSGRSTLTTNSYLNAIRRFYKWAEGHKYYPNIADAVESVKTEDTFKKQPLTESKAAQFLTNAEATASKRDYAILSLMAHTGLRCVEVVRADVRDITFINGVRVLMVQGKGHNDKDNFVVLGERTYEAIKAYLDERKAKDYEPLFMSRKKAENNGRMTTRSISRIAKGQLVAIGLDNSCYTAHSLRHTAGTAILRATGDIEMAQRTLRHKSSRITERYVHTLLQENRLQNNGETILDSLY